MNYGKSIAMLLATAMSLAVAALASDHVVTPTEWINIAIGVVTAASVFAAPNVPGARYTKLVLAVLGAVLALAVNLLAGGIDTSEWMQLGLAAFGALGVYAAPYTPGVRLAAVA